MATEKSVQDDIKLSARAVQGNRDAQQSVYKLAQPLIEFQTSRFCRRYCGENQFIYRCSLTRPIGFARADSAQCEWGNASYGWMLDDLCKPERLQKYEARNQAGLFDYLYSISNSLPFYERWKDWRFARKQRVPAYIQAIGLQAGKVFYGLRSQQDIATIAQQTAMSVSDVEGIAQQIVSVLTRKHKLYLLDPPKTTSLTRYDQAASEDHAHQLDIEDYDPPFEQLQQHEQLQQAWAELDPVEQFVLEAMVIEEQGAGEVLEALQLLDISIKPGTQAAQTSEQQLYYFKRKSLVRLAALLKS